MALNGKRDILTRAKSIFGFQSFIDIIAVRLKVQTINFPTRRCMRAPYTEASNQSYLFVSTQILGNVKLDVDLQLVPQESIPQMECPGPLFTEFQNMVSRVS